MKQKKVHQLIVSFLILLSFNIYGQDKLINPSITFLDFQEEIPIYKCEAFDIDARVEEAKNDLENGVSPLIFAKKFPVSLTPENSGIWEEKDDFGREAVATLIKRMEDDRDKLALILAGYTNEMTDFIDTNPGFKSRFNRYITFPDYTPNELFDIFESKCNRLDYHLTEEAKTKLKSTFENAYSSRDKSFGNGRFVRNIFEKTLEQQANRIAKEATLTKEILTTITEDDVSGVYVQAN